MATPGYIQRTLKMKPEVSKIFDDLEAWLDHCRFNLLNYDPKDLYRSKEYKEFQRAQEYQERKARREHRAPRQERENGEHLSH
jgi:hypothetical protein